MKRIGMMMVFLGLTAALAAQAPMKATTDDGKKILLSPDGTWKYAEAPAALSVVKGALAGYTKPKTATVSTKTVVDKFTLWMDPEVWTQEKGGDPNRLGFAHKKGDAYAIVIAERISMPMDSLKEIAVSNAKDAAPDVRVVFEETRTVNGVKLLCMKMAGTIQKIPFVYFGYYYAGKAGSLQVLTYTGENLFDEYKADFLDFLNGTVITE